MLLLLHIGAAEAFVVARGLAAAMSDLAIPGQLAPERVPILYFHLAVIETLSQQCQNLAVMAVRHATNQLVLSLAAAFVAAVREAVTAAVSTVLLAVAAVAAPRHLAVVLLIYTEWAVCLPKSAAAEVLFLRSA